MDILSTVIIVVISIATLFYAYFKYAYGYWKSRGVPHDEPSIPYGNIKGAGKEFHLFQIFKKIYDNHKNSGAKFCGAYFFARPVAILMDLDLIKSVFVKDFNNFCERNVYYNEKDDPVSANLFTLDGEKWKKLRTKLTPAFSSGKMKFMFPTIVEVGERFRDCLFELTQQHDQLEMKDLCARFTTDVIGTCALGIECNSLTNPNAEFREIGRIITKKRRHSPLVDTFLKGFREIGWKLHVKAVLDEVSSFFMNAVHQTVEYREKNHINRNDFLDILMKLKESPDKNSAITLNEIVSQSFLFFIGGFETSSSALTFCLYELSLNRDLQEKARSKVKEAFEKYDGKFSYEMLMDMPYIDQIADETLRKYPPGLFVTRETKHNYQVPETNSIIEKGVTVLIPIHAIHYDSEYYPNPEKFDPDRFETEAKQNRHQMTWLAFGGGPRNCIGLRFGLMQFKIGLVTLLNNFEFSLGSNMTNPIPLNKTSLVLVPEGHVNLKLTPLKH